MFKCLEFNSDLNNYNIFLGQSIVSYFSKSSYSNDLCLTLHLHKSIQYQYLFNCLLHLTLNIVVVTGRTFMPIYYYFIKFKIK